MTPQIMRDTKAWICHKNKIPTSPLTGNAVSVNDTTAWVTYDAAKEAVRKFGLDGIGFVFHGDWIGIDLDDCVENGQLNEFAKTVIAKVWSYTEYSPSKTGIHIIAKGKIDKALKEKEVEVYQTGRYFTVTDNTLLPYKPIRELDFDPAAYFAKPSEVQPRTNGVVPNNGRWLADELRTLTDGKRNNAFFKIASSLRHKGYSSEEIFELLKSKAKELDFPEAELQLVCKSAGKYEPGLKPFGKEQSDDINDFLADPIKTEWFCHPIIAKKNIHFVAGLPETGKTWMLIDLAIEMARGGGLWMGHYPVKEAKVLFLDQERSKEETQRRFRAVIAAKNITGKDLKGKLFVRCGSTTRIDLQPSFEAFRKELEEKKPDVVIVDSFATFHTKEESNRMEIQQVLERIKQLRDELGIAFIFIHHETKGAYQAAKDGSEATYLDMAGNVAIAAAAEIVLNVRRHDVETSLVHHTKNNLGKKVPPKMIKVTGTEEIKVEAF